MASYKRQVDPAARTDGFAQLLPSIDAGFQPRQSRTAWYRAPKVGGTPRAPPAVKPRLFETRKCLLDAAATSCTMLAAEELQTQASDAYLAASARSTVLEVATERRLKKLRAEQRLPKLDPGVGETVQRYLWRTRLHECWR
mmetsp:Transcript_33597/g.62972  ORF Transcript_33597/g.62972 Transcript_33597/m.62972 type:complete len:141 (+) Transcript_33597:94-516(+)